MNKNKIKEYIENQFVEDYEEIYKFMIDVNETLENMSFDKYESYNEFCIDIEDSILETVDSKIQTLTPKLIVVALNNMIKYKILKDDDYENKIRQYFDDPDSVIDDINKLKLKNFENN
jgi:hypothetical protein